MSEEHVVVSDNITPGFMTFTCSCGAHWKVTEKEYEAGIDHIEDHKRYALRTATRVD